MKSIKNVRLKTYNYSTNGYYFITLVSRDRQPFSDSEKLLIASRLGSLPQIAPGSKIDFHVIMQNHVHAIFILENCNTSLGEIIRKLKALCSKEAGRSLWQPNFYEHVISSEKALGSIREYIQNNPLEETIDAKTFY